MISHGFTDAEKHQCVIRSVEDHGWTANQRKFRAEYPISTSKFLQFVDGTSITNQKGAISSWVEMGVHKSVMKRKK